MVIVTGMSGAGKTQAVNALEDIGYYCVDNIPPRLIAKFADLPADSGGNISKIALVVDVRSQELFSEYAKCMEELSCGELPFKVLFLDCDNQSLFNRYKETRRRHPLFAGNIFTLEQAIAHERILLKSAKENADFVIDTSKFSAMQLRTKVKDLFIRDASSPMMITCNSFGFKHGVPTDSDLLFDVRCLPNPFYNESLRDLTGLDDPVRSFVLANNQAKGLLSKLTGLIDYLIPLYTQEGKSQLVISVGCTGGHHRSVVFCEYLVTHLAGQGVTATATHRDILR